ncbi:hypothetical protein [Methylopila sp. Yamaguchi]|uniref:hypothetical protein n=1 Tax=Methylopila sp. Yamaguchi TaxID=1437817 RepID=UPI000CCC0149|nr:hypothetical protein [Methylopila sp. Yamaguchi]
MAQAARATLAQIATPDAPVVFDGEVLSALHREKMIVFSMFGWRLTSGGWSALIGSAGGCHVPRVAAQASSEASGVPRRRASDLRAPHGLD